MGKALALVFLLIAAGTLGAADDGRFISKTTLPSGQTVVVAEGDFEPRSIGSYSVRLYDAAPPGDRTTFFADGLIMARDGVIEKVELADLNQDTQPEIIVVMRSVGTGGYLSAQSFSVDERHLISGLGISGLFPDADPLEALRELYSSGK